MNWCAEIKAFWSLNSDEDVAFVRNAMRGQNPQYAGIRTGEGIKDRKAKFALFFEMTLHRQSFAGSYKSLVNQKDRFKKDLVADRKVLGRKIAGLTVEVLDLQNKLTNTSIKKEVQGCLEKAIQMTVKKQIIKSDKTDRSIVYEQQQLLQGVDKLLILAEAVCMASQGIKEEEALESLHSDLHEDITDDPQRSSQSDDSWSETEEKPSLEEIPQPEERLMEPKIQEIPKIDDIDNLLRKEVVDNVQVPQMAVVEEQITVVEAQKTEIVEVSESTTKPNPLLLFSEERLLASLEKKDDFYKKLILPILNFLSALASGGTENEESARVEVLKRWESQLERILSAAQVSGSVSKRNLTQLESFLDTIVQAIDSSGFLSATANVIEYLHKNKISASYLLKQAAALVWPKTFDVAYDRLPSQEEVIHFATEFTQEGKLSIQTKDFIKNAFPKEIQEWPALFQISLLTVFSLFKSFLAKIENTPDQSISLSLPPQSMSLLQGLKSVLGYVPDKLVQSSAPFFAKIATAAVRSIPIHGSVVVNELAIQELTKKSAAYDKNIADVQLSKWSASAGAFWRKLGVFIKDRKDIDIQTVELVKEKIKLSEEKAAKTPQEDQEIQRDKLHEEHREELKRLNAEIEYLKSTPSKDLEREESLFIQTVSKDIIVKMIGRHNLKGYLQEAVAIVELIISLQAFVAKPKDVLIKNDLLTCATNAIAGAAKLITQFANEIEKLPQDYGWLVEALDKGLASLKVPTSVKDIDFVDWLYTSFLSHIPLLKSEPKELAESKIEIQPVLRTGVVVEKPSREEFFSLIGFDNDHPIWPVINMTSSQAEQPTSKLIKTIIDKGPFYKNMLLPTLEILASITAWTPGKLNFISKPVKREDTLKKWMLQLEKVAGLFQMLPEVDSQETASTTSFRNIVYDSFDFLDDCSATEAAQLLVTFVQDSKLTAKSILGDLDKCSLPNNFKIPFEKLPKMDRVIEILMEFVAGKGSLGKSTLEEMEKIFGKSLHGWPPLLQLILLGLFVMMNEGMAALATNKLIQDLFKSLPDPQEGKSIGAVSTVGKGVMGALDWAVPSFVVQGGTKLIVSLASDGVDMLSKIAGYNILSSGEESAQQALNLNIAFSDTLQSKIEKNMENLEKTNTLFVACIRLHKEIVEEIKILEEMAQEGRELSVSKLDLLTQKVKDFHAKIIEYRDFSKPFAPEILKDIEQLDEKRALQEKLEMRLKEAKSPEVKAFDTEQLNFAKMMINDLMASLLCRHELKPYAKIITTLLDLFPIIISYAKNPTNWELKKQLQEKASNAFMMAFSLAKMLAKEIHGNQDYAWLLQGVDNVLQNIKIPQDIMRTNWQKWMETEVLARFFVKN